MGTKPTSVGHPQGPATGSGCKDREQSTEKSSSHVSPSLCSEQISVGRWEAEPGPLWHCKNCIRRPWNAGERALRLMSPGGVIREGEAGHSLPGWSAEGSGQGVPMPGLWAPGGGGCHICSRAWTSRKNNSLHQGYSLNPASLNNHLS